MQPICCALGSSRGIDRFCPIAAVHLRPEDQRGPVKADIRIRFLRELSDCSANAGTAMRLSTLRATKQVLV
jgi:hypothetical protein